MMAIKAIIAKISASKIAMAAFGVAMISVVGAGAYFGVYVPNKPENVLATSIKNKLHESTQTGKGKATFSADQSPAVTFDYSFQNDSANQALAGQAEASISGVDIPFEFRLIDKSFYLKVGDLSTVKSLAAAFSGPEGAAVIDELSDKVTNKWIEFDESLLKTAIKAEQECDLFGATFNNDQIDQIFNIYNDNKFLKIKNTSSDEVDGNKVAKYDLTIDEDKAREFSEKLKTHEIFKKIEACAGNTEIDQEAPVDKFAENVELTAWVDKSSKQLVKIALVFSDQQGTLNADFTFTDEAVNVTKPDGATPALQLLGDLGPFFGIASGGSLTNPASENRPNNSSSGFSQECIEAFKKFSETQGRSPLPTQCTQ